MDYTGLRSTLDTYYKQALPKSAEEICTRVFAILDRYDAAHPGQNVYRLKARQYRVIAEEFTPVLFEELPFFYETGVLRPFCDGRFGRGGIHANGWVHLRNEHIAEDDDPARWKLYLTNRGSQLFSQCGPYCDGLHNGIPMEKVFQGGLKSAYDEVMAAKKQPLTEEEADFFDAAAAGLLALKRIAEKFSLAAAEKGMDTLAEIASRVPWEAPKTYHEGLCVLAFMRKCLGALEGVGFSSFGRPDVLLKDLFEQDLARGVTEEYMYDLTCRFLLIWDCALDRSTKMEGNMEYEYENTLTLGGCDRDGNPVWNGVTRLFLNAQFDLSIIYPKMMYRYSADSPEDYLKAISRCTLDSRSLGQYINDDSLIPAMIRSGIVPEDARRYVVGGCWDAITPEVSKKFSGEFFNVLRPLEWAIHRPEKDMEENQMFFVAMDGAESFEEFYAIYLENVAKLLRRKAELTAEGSRVWPKIAPACILSALMEPCIGNKKDITAGGGKYNWECTYFSAFADAADSLLAVKHLCFDEKICSLPELLDACRQDFPDETLRQAAIHAPSYGDGTEESARFAGRMMEDLYRISRDLPTIYGGQYRVGFCLYTEVIWWAKNTAATPNGRRMGEFISHGLTPSRLQPTRSVTDTVSALQYADLENYAGNSVMNFVLPLDKMNTELFLAFLRSLSKSGTQSVQINCVDRETLLKAQKDPEHYSHIIVRICGFSAPFTSLSPTYQEEFLSRNFY